MRYLLDTNVVSELAKRPADAKVVAWVNGQSAIDLFASVLTVGEITKGLASIAPGRRRDELLAWATQDLARLFLGRLLSVDETTAREWGRLAGEAKAAGRPLAVVDGLLIATATVHGLVLVTRNERACADRG